MVKIQLTKRGKTVAQITLLIADPLRLYCDALAISLGADPEFSVFAERPVNGPSAVAAAVRLRPAVALIDYWMPDMEGPGVAGAILAQIPECKVLLLSWLSGPAQVQQAVGAGALGIVPKDCTVAELSEVVKAAAAGENPLNTQALRDILDIRNERTEDARKGFETLTPREIEILVLLHEGNAAKQIAKRLDISPNTVRNQISAILTKTNTQSQGEALAKARSCGFLRP